MRRDKAHDEIGKGALPAPELPTIAVVSPALMMRSILLTAAPHRQYMRRNGPEIDTLLQIHLMRVVDLSFYRTGSLGYDEIEIRYNNISFERNA